MVSTRSELVPVAPGTPLRPVGLVGPAAARTTLLRDPLRPYVFFENDTGLIQTLPAGADPTDAGAWDQAGGAGVSAGIVHQTTGAPDPSLGANGDWAIDLSNPTALEIYGPKTVGAWGSAYPLTGPAGDDGAAGLSVLTGPTPPDNSLGVDEQVYIDYGAWRAYKKLAGAWDAGTPILGATGPAGPSGAGVVGDSAVPYTTEWLRAQRWRKLAGTAVAHTATASADYLTLATTAAGSQMVGPSIPIQQLANRTVVVEAQFTSVPGAGDGFFFGVGGLTYGTLDSGAAVVIAWRQNGAFVVNNSTAATVTTWTVSPGSYNLPSHVYAQNDVLRMVWKFGADASIATMTPFKNGVPTGQVFTITGITEGCLWTGGRLTASGQTLRILRLSVLDNAQKGYFWVDSAASPTGADGTEAKPYAAFAVLQDFVNATGLTRFEISARGSHRGRPPSFSGFDEVIIRASVGDDCTIYGSELVTSGWTATAGVTGVWERAGWLFDGVLNQPNGGVIDPNRVDGAIPFTMYSRAATNTAPASLVEGQTAIHTTGGNAQKLFIKTWGGVDPNTLPLELVNRTNCLTIANGAGVAKDCYAEVLGLRFRYASLYNLALDRVRYRVVEPDAAGSITGSCLVYLDASGETIAPLAVGAYNDLYATVESSSGPVTRRPRLYFSGVQGRGAKVGDGMSIHNTCNAVIEGAELTDNGKYGLVVAATVSGADVQARGVYCARNTDGNFANSGDPAEGLVQRLVLTNCHGEDAPVNCISANSSAGTLGRVLTEVNGGGMFDAGAGAGEGHFKLANFSADDTRVVVKTRGVITGGTGANVVNNGGTHENATGAIL